MGGFPAGNANALGVKEQTEAMNARSRVYENMQLDSHEKGIAAADRLWENRNVKRVQAIVQTERRCEDKAAPATRQAPNE